ncbi:MAG: hypothetical protein ABIT76_07725 [Chthoniobacterales bacterium]
MSWRAHPVSQRILGGIVALHLLAALLLAASPQWHERLHHHHDEARGEKSQSCLVDTMLAGGLETTGVPLWQPPVAMVGVAEPVVALPVVCGGVWQLLPGRAPPSIS